MTEPPNRVRMMLHDGSRLRDDRPIPKKFNDLVLLDVTKKMYDGSVKGKSHELGTEVKAIRDVEADNTSGFQVYIALIKNERVIQMGLPYIETASGEKAFLNAETIRLGNLEGLLSRLPPDVEIAVVWRLDKNMTQDIEITDKTILSSMNKPSQLEFSLLRQERKGCGGTVNQKLDLVADITEVSLFCGEENDPIRMSTGVLAPMENIPWDSFGSLFYPAEPLVSIQPQQIPRPSNLEYITELTVRTSWKEDLKTDGAISPSITLHYLPETTSPPAQHKANSMGDAAPSAYQQTQKQDFREEESMIIRLLMNPTERKLWGKLYGLPVEEEEPMPAMPKPVRCSDIPSSKKTPFSNFKIKTSSVVQLPKPKTTASLDRPEQDLRPSCMSQRPLPAPPKLMFNGISKKKRKKKKPTNLSYKERMKDKKDKKPRRNAPKQKTAGKPKMEKETKKKRTYKKKRVKPPVEPRINRKTPKNAATAKRRKKTSEVLKPKKRRTAKKKKMKSYFFNQMLGLYKKRARAGRTRAQSSG